MAVSIHTNGDLPWRGEIETALVQQLAAFRLGIADVPVHFDATPPTWASGDLVLYRHDPLIQISPTVEADLARHVQQGRRVVPVIKALTDASSLPPSIANLNSFVEDRHGSNWAAALVDEILASLWLSRSTRKLFISYRRGESADVAEQFRQKLTRLGWEVFLDEASIEPGADFQREVHASMVDADLLLLLATPRLHESKWVADEVDFADAWMIGVLAVQWPPDGSGPDLLQILHPDQKTDSPVGPGDFRGKRLKSSVVDRIVGQIYETRTRAIRHRLDQLLLYARSAYGRNGRLPVASGLRLGDLIVARRYVRVLPYRPQLTSLHDLTGEIDGEVRSGRISATTCFYGESEPNDPRAAALAWLNENPPFRCEVDVLLGGVKGGRP